MKIIKTVDEFLYWRTNQSESLGFVPTLGALHAGHLSLIKQSKAICSITVVSIFLNPLQFSPNEDLGSYPQTLDVDIKNLKKLEIDVLFLPTEKEMFKTVDDVCIQPTELFNKLEGASRPHFFYGVTTIVAKLFNVILPSHAFFGKKDAQQLLIIDQMIVSQNYNIKLVACSTIRNKNGLALSSRNQYLNTEEQQKASVVYSGLMHIKDCLEKGQKNTLLLKNVFYTILKQVPEISIDYISIACANTLNELEHVANRKLLISTAVFFNGVRLIDNFSFHPST